MAAHANLPLSAPGSSAFGLVLNAVGHAVGWPFPEGGAGALTQALADHLRALGGTIETGAPVDDVEALPSARAVLLNLTPRQVLRVARPRLPDRYARRLETDRYRGALDLQQIVARPVLQWTPFCLPAQTVGGAPLCLSSASTPPGGGVHGMCGTHAAHTALSDATR